MDEHVDWRGLERVYLRQLREYKQAADAFEEQRAEIAREFVRLLRQVYAEGE